MDCRRRWIASLCLLALVSGCFREPTAADRLQSFTGLSQTRIGDLSLADHTARRTVYLLATPSGELVADRPGRLVLTNLRSPGEEFRLYTGTAVVLTHDGYLLTAAHCAATPNLSVIRSHAPDGGALGAFRPRVVWLGKSGDAVADLAILKVDAAFDHTFDWANLSDLRRRTPVAIAGIDLAHYRLSFTYAAGHVRDPRWLNMNTPPIHALTHNAPLRRGDSGGPLVTTDGKLAAINVAVRYGLGPQFSVSLRPDPGWITAVIEADRRVQGRTQPRMDTNAHE